MSEVIRESQGRTQLTIINKCGAPVYSRITASSRVLLKGHFQPVSYPDCGDIYPAALAQARGWLAEFANQKTQVSYDANGRVAEIQIFDQTGVTLIATKTITRDANGFLQSVQVSESVSGKTMLRTFVRDSSGRVQSVDRTFTVRT